MPDDFANLTTLPTEEPPEEDGALSELPGAEGDASPNEDNEPEILEEEPTYDLVLKGEYGEDRQVKVTLDDLKKGFMMHDDYTKKTITLAKTRDTLEQQIHEANTRHRTEYIQTLESMRKMMMDALEPEIANVNWQSLSKEDPEEYLRLHARVTQHNALVQRISDEQYSKVQEQAKQDHVMRRQMIEDSVNRLSEPGSRWHIPGWGDALYGEILSTIASTYGFSAEEVGSIIDPRMVKAMHDLMKYQKAVRKPALKAPTGAVRQAEPKQPVPVSIPASSSPGISRDMRYSKAVERARQTGSVQDAALALTLRQKARR